MKFLSPLLILLWLFCATSSFAAGYGVFTQGAAGLGQANAVVAHPTGPSSLYFNPALLNDVPGRQLEIGTTAILVDRHVELEESGRQVNAHRSWDFPSTFYYTHQISEHLTAGLGTFFPFGLSTDWDEDYAGRYLGTSGEMFSLNINPALSWRITEDFSLAAGFDLVYIDVEIDRKVNQSAVGGMLPPMFGGPILDSLPDSGQSFTGTGWGAGYNLGLLYRLTDRVSFGAAYRSEIEVEFDHGKVRYHAVDPRLQPLFLDTGAAGQITLPAQCVAGLAVRFTPHLLTEIGVRWEDWTSEQELKIDLERAFLGQASLVIPRDWRATWAYNAGLHYQVSPQLALNAGYLYAENPVPDRTLEPTIPDADAHLLTLGLELQAGNWTVAGALGLEYHEERTKQNRLGDPLGSVAAGQPVATANGEYATTAYLFGLSLGYRFE